MVDPCKSPLAVIDELFKRAGCPALPDTQDWGVQAYYEELTKNMINSGLQIPTLNGKDHDLIPQNGLCRYVGMVQDVLDPECYIGAYQQQDGQWKTTKFRDHINFEDLNGASNTLWDRKPLYCIRPSGLSSWADTANEPRSTRDERTPAEGSIADHHKRQRQEDDADMILEDDTGSLPSRGSKSHRPEASVLQSAVPNTPASEEGDCLVYIHQQSDHLRVNDVIEVVGVLSRAPELAAVGQLQEASDGSFNEAGSWEDDLSALPPTSQAIRLHAVLVRKLSGHDQATRLLVKGSSELRMQAAGLRQIALDILAAALGKDRLAAEYLLLQMISRWQKATIYPLGVRIHSREANCTLGGLSINLTHCPSLLTSPTPAPGSSSFGQALHAAIAALLPYSVLLPLGADQLNTAKLQPRRGNSSRRLVKGALQLAEGTHLLLDETLMRPGQLTHLGVINLQAIQGLLETMTVDYDFEFYKLPMPSDVAVTVLSEGKSLLHGSIDVILPLHPVVTLGTLDTVTEAMTAVDLTPVRSYLAYVRHLDFAIEPEVARWLEGRIVASRQAEPDCDERCLHTWLTVARLLAQSHGEGTLRRERWDEMLAMEHKRKERLRLHITRATAV